MSRHLHITIRNTVTFTDDEWAAIEKAAGPTPVDVYLYAHAGLWWPRFDRDFEVENIVETADAEHI